MFPDHKDIMTKLKGGEPQLPPPSFEFTKINPTRPEPKITDTPILDKVRGSVDSFKKVDDLNAKMWGSIVDFVQEWGAKNRERQDKYGNTLGNIVSGAKLAKTVAQETVAGGVSIAKSFNELIGAKDMRTPEQQAALEQMIFGRPVRSIQEAYVDPTLQYAEEQGSGALEKYGLATGAVLGGVMMEAPGSPFKKPAKEVVDALVGVTDEKVVRSLLGIEIKNESIDRIITDIAKETDRAKVEGLTNDLRRVVRASKDAQNYTTPDAFIGAQRRVFRGENGTLTFDTSNYTSTPTDNLSAIAAELKADRKTLNDLSYRIEYHGTLPENVDSILKNGFKVGDGQKGVSTTQDYAEALDYANGNPDGVLAVYVKDPSQIAGTPGVDFITGTGSFSPNNLIPLRKGKYTKGEIERFWKDSSPSLPRARASAPQFFIPRDAAILKVDQPAPSNVMELIVKNTEGDVKRQVVQQIEQNPSVTTRELMDTVSGIGETSPVLRTALERAGYDGIEYPKTATDSAKIDLFDEATLLDEDTLRRTFQSVQDEMARPKPERLNIPKYQQALKAQDAYLTSFRERVEDSLIRLKAIVNDPTMKVADESNPYVKEELFHGKVDTLLQEGRQSYQTIVDGLNDIAIKHGVDPQKLDDYFNDYLVARHAGERNAKLGNGAAGMTNEQANDILQDVASTPYARELEAVANAFDDFAKKPLQVLLETGVITRELFDKLHNQYKHYTPLNRIMENDADLEQLLVGGRYEVRGTGLRAAKGSDREVRDVLGNATANYQDAIMRGEKNVVLNALGKLVEDNPDNPFFEFKQPKAIGEMFAKEGEKRPLILERLERPDIIAFRREGKPVYVQVNDIHLANAIHGINLDKLPSSMRFIQATTRFLAGLYTRFNVEFALANKVRDLQEAVVYLFAQEDLKARRAIRAAGVRRNIQTSVAVTDWHLGRDTAGARLYEQMRKDGGITGGRSMMSRGDIELDINKYRKLSRSRTRRGFDKLIRSVDAWNTIFEDSTRLAAYKEALDQGLSRQRAASIAKNVSINFNRRGTAGPIVNAIYIFSNASIQGSAKLIMSMRDWRVAAGVVSSVGFAVFAAHEWNDGIDPDWRDKVTVWDRMNGLPILLPSSTSDEFKYFTIPVSWGLKPINVMMNEAFDLRAGKAKDPKDAIERILTAAVSSYNPLGGTDPLSVVMPTIIDPFVDVARNKSWTGSSVMPNLSRYTPDSLRYFPSLAESASGRLAIDLSKGLSGVGLEVSPQTFVYLFDQYTGGPGSTATKVIDAVKAVASEDDSVELDKLPFLSRFYRVRTGEEIGAGGEFYLRASEKLTDQARETVELKLQAEDSWSQIKGLPKEDAVKLYSEIYANDKDLASKINEIMKEEALGLTFNDRQVKQMGVRNGARAEFIAEEIKRAQTREEKMAIWENYTTKKLITPEVQKQIFNLMKQ